VNEYRKSLKISHEMIVDAAYIQLATSIGQVASSTPTGQIPEVGGSAFATSSVQPAASIRPPDRSGGVSRGRPGAVSSADDG
jgi:hypothetical protein